MRYGMYVNYIIKRFLPPTAKIIMLETPYKIPAVGMVDMDGDGVSELVGAYYWQGENYIIVLKYFDNDWNVVNTIKVRGYNITNQLGIDFLSVKSINSETKRDLKLEEAIKKEFDLNQEVENIRYYYNKIDLNGDGIPEVFVYLVGSYVCGTGGCSGAIFKQENSEYKLLSRFSLVRNPVIISNSKTNGYRDIIMYVAGGGIESFYARVKYDGTTYPFNPSVQPKVEPGTKVDGIAIVADDIAKNPGIDLKINH